MHPQMKMMMILMEMECLKSSGACFVSGAVIESKTRHSITSALHQRASPAMVRHHQPTSCSTCKRSAASSCISSRCHCVLKGLVCRAGQAGEQHLQTKQQNVQDAVHRTSLKMTRKFKEHKVKLKKRSHGKLQPIAKDAKTASQHFTTAQANLKRACKIYETKYENEMRCIACALLHSPHTFATHDVPVIVSC